VASTWDEVVQVLEVKACSRDRDEIQRQITSYLNDLKTSEDRQNLYQKLIKYLGMRALELDAKGGKESPEYRREDTVIAKLIVEQRLQPENLDQVDDPGEINEPDDPEPPPPDYLMSQLERLAKLQAAGVLSDQEFQAAKQKLLGL
jgi:hypothetical protein